MRENQIPVKEDLYEEQGEEKDPSHLTSDILPPITKCIVQKQKENIQHHVHQTERKIKRDDLPQDSQDENDLGLKVRTETKW